MSFWDDWNLKKAKETGRELVDLLVPEFLGTDAERAKNRERVAGDVEEEIQRRRRRLNAVDVPGEPVVEAVAEVVEDEEARKP